MNIPSHSKIEELDKRLAMYKPPKGDITPPEDALYTPPGIYTTTVAEAAEHRLRAIRYAFQHHYENNTHHPEHFENGIDGMSLLDLLEMFCDWQAACMRHADGDITKSLEINRKRFGMSDQLHNIFQATLSELWG